MALTITGGETLHSKTGQPPIILTDADMAAIRQLQAAGIGQQEIPQGAVGALAELRRQRAVGIGNMTRGQRYEAWKATLDYHLRGGGGTAVQKQLQRDQALLRDGMRGAMLVPGQKAVDPASVHADALLTTLAVQYANDAYIGDELCPVVLVAKQTGLIPMWDKRNRLAAPDDALGDMSEANEIQETRSRTSYITLPYGLKNYVPVTTLANQDAPYDEMVDVTESVMEVMGLRREIRQGDLLCTSGNYGANTKAIPAADRWDTAGGGDPIKDMQDADAALWTGRGPSDKVMFSSLSVYNVLSRHPDILSLFMYNGSSPGLATPDMIARFLMADRYLVGRARKDTANESQVASYSRIWSDVFGLIRVPRGNATIRNAFFAATIRWLLTGVPNLTPSEGWVTQQWFEATKGFGAYYSRAAVSEVQQVIASDTGYLYTTPIG